MAVRKYELLVLYDPVRTEEQQQETTDKIKSVLEQYDATVEKVDVWGKRRLAYPINRRREGYYVLFLFDTEATGPALTELERHCRFAEEIYRHMVTHAVVGKSTGDPALLREDRMPRVGGPRTLAGGPPTGGPRGPYQGPRPAQPAAAPAQTATADAPPAGGAPQAPATESQTESQEERSESHEVPSAQENLQPAERETPSEEGPKDPEAPTKKELPTDDEQKT